MSIACPHCQFAIKLKAVKAGRYTPRCPKCGKSFALSVTGEEGSYQFSASIPPAKASPPPKVEPPRREDTEATAAAMASQGDPEATSPHLPSPPVAQQPDDAGAFGQTEHHDTGPAPVEATRAGPAVADDASFEVRQEPVEEESPAEEEEPRDKNKKKGDIDIPKTLGGYEILEVLGQGGMGTVYLARQVSLDRPVALKVMNRRWASDPVFVARFTREAYAAAQLVHHNVVQIYDIGQDQGVSFFSMEYVKGQTLAHLVKKEGKLDVDVAVGYVLQAARGLKAAHDLGMVHRDVKPDNLMLNELGVVKVADLGLVKTPGTQEPAVAATSDRAAGTGSLGSLPSVTNVGSAVGTPMYMAPEQAMHASNVDHRADIYSLGCTLYVLVTGRPPFKGKTAMEVLTRHLKDPPIPPEVVSKRVPKEVSALVLKMMAKKPDDRHADMDEVIAECEEFLGVSRIGPFSPSEEHADALEEAVKGFNNAPAARIRWLAMLGFHGGLLLLALLCCLFSPRLAGGLVGFSLMTALLTFLVRGITEKTYLFQKVREFILGSGPADWLTWGGGVLLIVAVLYVVGLLPYWLAFLVLSGAAAGTIRVLIDRPLVRQRKEPIEKAEKLLRQLRLKGLPEEAVRQFVCKYAGTHWEEFFEALFGYEALLAARKLWSRPEGGKPRPTHAAWRDPIVQWIDARQRARKEARERKHLQEIERKKLEAEGASAAEAEQKSAEAAAVLVSAAAQIKTQADQPAIIPDDLSLEAEPIPVATPVDARVIFAADEPKGLPPEIKKKLNEKPGTNPLWLIFGGHVRFLVGLVLVILCFLWVNQNDLVPDGGTDFKSYVSRLHDEERTKPLGFLPEPLSGFHLGLAGVVLALSALTRSGKLLFFLVVAVIVLLALPFVLWEEMGRSSSYVALLAGFALTEFGCIFNRHASRPK